MKPGRPHGVDVAADPEHHRPLLGRESVVDDDSNRRALTELEDDVEQEAAEFIRVPGATREEAVVRLMVPAASDPSYDERLGDRVGFQNVGTPAA